MLQKIIAAMLVALALPLLGSAALAQEMRELADELAAEAHEETIRSMELGFVKLKSGEDALYGELILYETDSGNVAWEELSFTKEAFEEELRKGYGVRANKYFALMDPEKWMSYKGFVLGWVERGETVLIYGTEPKQDPDYWRKLLWQGQDCLFGTLAYEVMREKNVPWEYVEFTAEEFATAMDGVCDRKF